MHCNWADHCCSLTCKPSRGLRLGTCGICMQYNNLICFFLSAWQHCWFRLEALPWLAFRLGSGRQDSAHFHRTFVAEINWRQPVFASKRWCIQILRMIVLAQTRANNDEEFCIKLVRLQLICSAHHIAGGAHLRNVLSWGANCWNNWLWFCVLFCFAGFLSWKQHHHNDVTIARHWRCELATELIGANQRKAAQYPKCSRLRACWNSKKISVELEAQIMADDWSYTHDVWLWHL